MGRNTRSPLVNLSYFYFIGGLVSVLVYGYFIDRAATKFLAAAWVAVGSSLALITYGASRKATSEVAQFIYLLGLAWLVLLLAAGIYVLRTDGIGVQELDWLTG